MNKENKLTLKRNVKMETQNTDVIMSNQQAMFTYDENVDFSLDLTSDIEVPKSETPAFQDTLKSSMDEIKNLMNERNELSKSRESIIYGIKNDKYPSWIKFHARSHFRVSNENDTTKFNELWASVIKEGTEQIMKHMVTFLEREIACKEAHMTKSRKEAFDAYPDATKGWLEAKKNFDENILALNKENSIELSEFKVKLSLAAQKHGQQDAVRGRDTYRNKRFRGGRGRGKFRPY